MEVLLQKFVESMATLADIRNVDIGNPVVFNLEHPVTATRYVTVAALNEPSAMGIPINATWTVLDTQSAQYKQCLKLVSTSAPTTAIPGVTLISGYTQSWKLLTSYAEIFDTPQYYDNGSGGGVAGPQGPAGAAGPAGPAGAAGVIDYPYIIAEVLRLAPPPVSPTGVLTIVGADTLVENSTSQYVARLTVGTNVLPLAIPMSVTGTGATINASNLLSAGSVSADSTVSLACSLQYNGAALAASKSVSITNSAIVSIALSGLPVSMNEGSTSQLVVTATYSNGTTANVTSSSTFVTSTALGASVSASGLVTAASVSADTAFTVTATYMTKTAVGSSTSKNSAVILYPYFGAALTTAPITEALVTSLAQRGTTGTRLMPSIQILDSTTTSLYYAYPVSYGTATFTDLGNGFQGGWDGAHKDGGGTSGPVTINVAVSGIVTPFYVYQADYPNISPASSPTNWAVS